MTSEINRALSPSYGVKTPVEATKGECGCSVSAKLGRMPPLAMGKGRVKQQLCADKSPTLIRVAGVS